MGRLPGLQEQDQSRQNAPSVPTSIPSPPFSYSDDATSCSLSTVSRQSRTTEPVLEVIPHVQESQPPCNLTTSSTYPVYQVNVVNQVSSVDVLPMSELSSNSLTFLKRNDRFYSPDKQTKLMNNLQVAVGFLELANAGDFAANVWNFVPAPPYAIALMALGGTVAFGILYFAFKDALLSWRNLRGLWDERNYLTLKARQASDQQLFHAPDFILDVNFRDMGTELVDRIGMDSVLGFGALMVGTGTFMALGGANHTVFQISNLLSGYIGNVPCALYGLANLAWSAFVFNRARQHAAAGKRAHWPLRVKQRFNSRLNRIYIQCVLSGTTGVVSGAASIFTATQPWAYVVLAPCIATSVLVNYIWRNKLGYNRPYIRQTTPLTDNNLISWLMQIDAARDRASAYLPGSASAFVSDPASLPCLLDFITRHQLFDELCVRILRDVKWSTSLFQPCSDKVTIRPADLAAIARISDRARLVKIAQCLVVEAAPSCFGDLERFILELLGCSMCARHHEAAMSAKIEA